MSGADYFEPGEVFDSRDVLDRIEFLANEDDLTPEEEDELDELRALQAEAMDYVADWQYGEAFISDDHFEDYARGLTDEIAAVNDWKAAVDELKEDYTSFEFRGTTYWAR